MDTSSDVAHVIVVTSCMDTSSDVAHVIVVMSNMYTSSDIAHTIENGKRLKFICTRTKE
jgi:hypothetical protein